MQISHHHLLPPTHHELRVVFYVLVQPLDVLHSVYVVEICPQQPLEVVLVHALQVLRYVRKANQLLQGVQVDGLLQDEGEAFVVLVAPLRQDLEDGGQQLMNKQRNFSMRFEEQFAVDIVDQSICQFAEKLHEMGVLEKYVHLCCISQIHFEQIVKIANHQLSHNLKRLMDVDRLNQPGHIVEVLIKCILVELLLDFFLNQVVNFVDVVDIVRIDPDDGDDVEEIPPLVVVVGIGEDGLIDLVKQIADQLVQYFKRLMIVFLQSRVDSFEQLQRIVNNLIFIRLQVVDAQFDVVLQKCIE